MEKTYEKYISDKGRKDLNSEYNSIKFNGHKVGIFKHKVTITIEEPEEKYLYAYNVHGNIFFLTEDNGNKIMQGNFDGIRAPEYDIDLNQLYNKEE